MRQPVGLRLAAAWRFSVVKPVGDKGVSGVFGALMASCRAQKGEESGVDEV